ncbi:MAG: PLP-dependent aminotransferase family protein [Spirochaetaceae bacterium]|nr:PLP-dependent aminotransferase family protein [Spirochaetaceae bacterium]
MITIKSNTTDNNTPLYLRVFSAIASDIVNGKRKEGEKLPSIRNCASDLGISKNTVEAAYYELLAEGYIESRPKKGFFVCAVSSSLKKRWTTGASYQQTKEHKEPHSLVPDTGLIDLQANSIDESLFPYTVLRKLYRETVSGNKAGLFLTKGEAQGDSVFRTAISRYLSWSKGLLCSEDSIIIGAGTEYLLQFAIKILHRYRQIKQGINSPVSFLLETPGYDKIRSIVVDEGCTVTNIPLDNEGITIQSLMNDIRTSRTVYVTPAHQYPLGITMSYRRRKELLEWAKKTDSFIIEDDYDSDFYYTGKILPPLQSMDDNDTVLYMGTFSRSLAPSMRVSYLVLNKKLLSIYQQYFKHYSCTVSRIEQHVIEQFMTEGHFERHINRTRKVYRQRRDAMIRLLLQNFPQGKIFGEHAGLHFIFELPSTVSGSVFEQTALEKGLKIKTLESPINTGNFLCLIGYAHLTEEDMKKTNDIIVSLK